jgi:hypothetical protein
VAQALACGVCHPGKGAMSIKQPPSPDSRGFEPIEPWKSEYLVVRRRNLPHLEVPGATYFVTFHCRSGVELAAQARDVVIGIVLANLRCKISAFSPTNSSLRRELI